MLLTWSGETGIPSTVMRRATLHVSSLGLALFALSAALVPAMAQEQAPVPAVDTTDRQQVVDLYTNYYLPGNTVAPGWTGDLATGDPGTLSTAYRQATLQRINYYRAMSGLNGNLAFGATEDADCEQAALMFAVENNISHTPTADWPFFTAGAALAAYDSDIRLDSAGDEGPGAVDRFIADAESNNFYVGHRRWLLYAGEGEMGAGAVPSSDSNPGTAAIWIMNFVSRPAGAPVSTSWPPAGYVPADLAFDRWSFSYLNADFSAATVSVTKNGAPLSVNLETPEFESSGPGTDFVGDNTLVWELPGNSVSPTADETYAVHLENVQVAGVATTFDYAVTTINAAPPAVSLTVAIPVAHRAAGSKAKIVLTRGGDTSEALTVPYVVTGTGVPGVDYTALTGSAIFKAGKPMAKIVVLPATTAGLAGKKTVIITLQPGGDYTLDATAASGTMTIRK